MNFDLDGQNLTILVILPVDRGIKKLGMLNVSILYSNTLFMLLTQKSHSGSLNNFSVNHFGILTMHFWNSLCDSVLWYIMYEFTSYPAFPKHSVNSRNRFMFIEMSNSLENVWLAYWFTIRRKNIEQNLKNINRHKRHKSIKTNTKNM